MISACTKCTQTLPWRTIFSCTQKKKSSRPVSGTEEAIYISKMTQNVQATIWTPVRDTPEITLEEIVRQGTVGGVKLCGAWLIKLQPGYTVQAFKLKDLDDTFPLDIMNVCQISQIKHCVESLIRNASFPREIRGPPKDHAFL